MFYKLKILFAKKHFFLIFFFHSVKFLILVLQISSPTSCNARGYVTGEMFNQKGEVRDYLFTSLYHTLLIIHIWLYDQDLFILLSQ